MKRRAVAGSIRRRVVDPSHDGALPPRRALADALQPAVVDTGTIHHVGVEAVVLPRRAVEVAGPLRLSDARGVRVVLLAAAAAGRLAIAAHSLSGRPLVAGEDLLVVGHVALQRV